MSESHIHEFGQRLAKIEGAVVDIKEAIKTISVVLQGMATLNQKHIETSAALTRAFNEITSLQERVVDIEMALPILKLTSKWVITGVIATVGIVGVAVVYLVVHV